ncbi:MAG: glycosyltransferase [Flavobacteriales bacterium]|nr:glycosyltransferase [Flavobacteriales bacterium]
MSTKIMVDTGLFSSLQNISFFKKIRTLCSIIFLREILKVGLKLDLIKRAYSVLLEASVVDSWIGNFLENEPEGKQIVFYSFWNDSATLGMVLAQSSHKNIKVVSRCHNYDLYGNEDNEFYIPYQEFVFDRLDTIFPDSLAGLNYISTYFPRSKAASGIMGVPSPGFNVSGSSDGIFRIVSCAYMIPRKRIKLFIEGLEIAAIECPSSSFEWYHIGSGPLWDEITSSSKNLPSNCTTFFKGNMSSEGIMELYEKCPFDLFVNTSTKEGTPVSLMEAISCGIPILATAFGGNKEIAELGGGELLSEDPTKEEIALKIKELNGSEKLLRYKESCKQVWKNHYDAQRNYQDFCARLLHI